MFLRDVRNNVFSKILYFHDKFETSEESHVFPAVGEIPTLTLFLIPFKVIVHRKNEKCTKFYKLVLVFTAKYKGKWETPDMLFRIWLDILTESDKLSQWYADHSGRFQWVPRLQLRDQIDPLVHRCRLWPIKQIFIVNLSQSGSGACHPTESQISQKLYYIFRITFWIYREKEPLLEPKLMPVHARQSGNSVS